MSRGVIPPKLNKCLGGLLQSTSRGGLDKVETSSLRLGGSKYHLISVNSIIMSRGPK